MATGRRDDLRSGFLFRDPAMRHTGQVRVVVTKAAGDGSIRRGGCATPLTAAMAEYEQLIEQAAPGVPPPPPVGKRQAVYQIRSEGTVVVAAEKELAGPLRHLVMTALAE